MRIMPTLASLAVPVVLLGGIVAAEDVSRRSLTDDLTERIEQSLDGVEVTHVNLRGRPYLLSRNNDEVSTAYVDIRTAEPGASSQLLVQRLDLNSDRAGRVRVLVTLPYPGAGVPIENHDGSYSARATVDGEEVTFRADFHGGQVTISEEGGPDVGTVKVPDIPGLSLIEDPIAIPQGVRVVLTSSDVLLAN